MYIRRTLPFHSTDDSFLFSPVSKQQQQQYGREVGKSFPIQFDCGLDIKGNPIHIEWYGTMGQETINRMEAIGYDKINYFCKNVTLRLQIQLDILSREQQRLAKSVIIIQMLHTSWWKMFKGGSRMIEYLKQGHCRIIIGATCPESIAGIFWVGCPSWTVKTFINNVIWLFPKRMQNVVQILGLNY